MAKFEEFLSALIFKGYRLERSVEDGAPDGRHNVDRETVRLREIGVIVMQHPIERFTEPLSERRSAPR